MGAVPIGSALAPRSGPTGEGSGILSRKSLQDLQVSKALQRTSTLTGVRLLLVLGEVATLEPCHRMLDLPLRTDF